jgi:thiamine-monophosphate kinase
MSSRRAGEDALIQELLRNAPRGSRLIAGPGDDCAVIGRPRDPVWSLMKTECLVEGVHFRSDDAPRLIGRKLLARALSDFAAMGGGEPRHALVTLAAPPDCTMDRLRGIYSGLGSFARRYGVGIVGGETSRTVAGFFLSVSVIGEIEAKRCVFRSGAKSGDAVFVTGRLGGSIKGRHLRFEPRLEEARWLTARFKLGAMMDLSDGLGSDLPRLTGASRVGYRIDSAMLPRATGASPEQAWADGEDYELLFTISRRQVANLMTQWRRAFPRLNLTRIGEIVRDRGTREGGFPISGYDHFAER